MKGEYIKYIFALLLFGSNGIVASSIPLHSYEIVLLRTLVGSLFLIPIFSFSEKKLQGRRNRKHFVYLVVSGAAMGTSWMFLYEAYTQIGVGIATLIYYCGPVIVMALSSFLFRESLTRAVICGFVAVFAGMLLLNATALSSGGKHWGILCGIFSAVLYSVMVIFNKKATSVSGLENSMWQLVISFITVAIFTLFQQKSTPQVILRNILPILILGIVNTGIGCYLYFSAVHKLRVQSVAIWGYLEPLSALFFSFLFLHEEMSILQAVGAAFIIGGAAYGEYSNAKRRKAAELQRF